MPRKKKAKTRKRKSAIPSLCWLTDADAPEVEQLWQRLNPGCGPDPKRKDVNVGLRDADGKLSMVFRGDWHLTLAGTFIADPALEATDEVKHSAEFMMESLRALAERNTDKGNMGGVMCIAQENLLKFVELLTKNRNFIGPGLPGPSVTCLYAPVNGIKTNDLAKPPLRRVVN